MIHNDIGYSTIFIQNFAWISICSASTVQEHAAGDDPTRSYTHKTLLNLVDIY